MTTYKKMTLKFREISWSLGAKVLDYIDWYPEFNEFWVLEILKWHCLPHVLDRSDPKNKEIVHHYALLLEAKARSIREAWNLPRGTYQETIARLENTEENSNLENTEENSNLENTEENPNLEPLPFKTRRRTMLGR